MSPEIPHRQILKVHRQLVRCYGEPKRKPRRDALSQLIATILSQHTTDVNTARAFDHLRAEFPTWEGVRDAPTRAVVRTIRSAGLANTKAPRIQAILQQLTRERGSLSLNFLRKMRVEEAKAYSLRLKGGWPENGIHRLALCVRDARISYQGSHIFQLPKRRFRALSVITYVKI